MLTDSPVFATVPSTHSPFTTQCLPCVKPAGYSHVKTYNIEISRDTKPPWLTQLKTLNIKHSRREIHEPETHWAYSQQPMVPCTPPEFLKMVSHPATPPQRRRFLGQNGLCWIFSLLGPKPQQPRLARLGEKPYRSCVFSITSSHYIAPDRKIPLWGLYVTEMSYKVKPETVVEMVVVEKIFKLVQNGARIRCSVYFCNLSNRIDHKNNNGQLVKKTCTQDCIAHKMRCCPSLSRYRMSLYGDQNTYMTLVLRDELNWPATIKS